jgi:glycosyltransferase 2 family protein
MASRIRRIGWTLFKLAITVSLLGLMASRMKLSELARAFLSVRAVTIGWGILLYCCSMWIAGLRWRVLFDAYGARRTYSVPRLVFLYMVGLFYNTVVPGAIGGDVLRAHLVKDAYGSPFASYAAVLLERVFGFAALACLSAIALLMRLSGRDATDLAPYLVVSGLAVIATLVAALQAPAIARRLAARWGERGMIGQLLGLFARAPDLARPRLLLGVMILSFGTQLVGVIATYLVTRDLCPRVGMLDCLLFVPLANIASYMPLTVGGLGARETVFVVLFARIGVPRPSSLATSLVVFGIQVILALAGGALQLMSPLSSLPATRGGASDPDPEADQPPGRQ